MRPLAIIESDEGLAGELRAAVESAGFRAECFRSGAQALAQVGTRTHSLAVVAIDPREADPFAVCRGMSGRLPVITVAGDCAADTCARALENGADDCVQRAISARELIARIRSVLRRSAIEDDARFAAFSLSLSEMRIGHGQAKHDLTYGETQVLQLLVEHAPAPVAVLRICEILGAPRNTVESRIKSLRRKLGPGRLISRGSLGYQLVAGDETGG